MKETKENSSSSGGVFELQNYFVTPQNFLSLKPTLNVYKFRHVQPHLNG